MGALVGELASARERGIAAPFVLVTGTRAVSVTRADINERTGGPGREKFARLH